MTAVCTRIRVSQPVNAAAVRLGKEIAFWAFSVLLAMSLTSCRRERLPPYGIWSGTVDLKDGVFVPFKMELDFSSTHPRGFFLVGDEKTPIPEISKMNDSVVLGFSEYGAEVRATW